MLPDRTVRLIDLGQASLAPGLIDLHSHFVAPQACGDFHQELRLSRAQQALGAVVHVIATGAVLTPGTVPGAPELTGDQMCRSPRADTPTSSPRRATGPRKS
ncbi:hypothetical protein ACFZAV_27615 [Streptomyces sp. NPDC008343]|uniref:hypothetical protein n=1 Tax=Streptomyces sp. NPDC008343 TaxID=3364828 RepID=UPI0036EE37C0